MVKISRTEMEKYLIKGGSNKEHAKQLLDKNWDNFNRIYSGQRTSKKEASNVIRTWGRR
jgi:hypothetical protein